MNNFTVHTISSDDSEYFEDFEDADDGILPPDYAIQAAIVASKAGIGITRDRELTAVAVDSNGIVVGAAWTAMDHETYEFDVAVLPEFQGNGVGRELLDRVIDPPYEDIELNLTQRVVSPIMYQALLSRGFEVSAARVFDLHRQEVDLDMRPCRALKDVLQHLYTHDPDTYTEIVTQYTQLEQGAQSMRNIMTHHGKPSQLDVKDREWLHAMVNAYNKTCAAYPDATTRAAIQSLSIISGQQIKFNTAQPTMDTKPSNQVPAQRCPR